MWLSVVDGSLSIVDDWEYTKTDVIIRIVLYPSIKWSVTEHSI